MEEQVAQAALAMVSPTTDGPTRRQASQFLEEWTLTPEAWEVYGKWLRHFRLNSDENKQRGDQIAMQLLALTMLQTKIRKEIPRASSSTINNGGGHPLPPSVVSLRQELWEYLGQNSCLDNSLKLPCCICNAAILIRCGMLSDLLSMLNSQSFSQEMALKVLACLPSEMEACRDLTTPEVTAELMPFLHPVLEIIRNALNPTNGSASNTILLLPACQALKEWVTTAHISMSQLNTQGILPLLIQFLSTNTFQDELVLQLAAQALTAAVMVIGDACTPEREAAAGSFWNAIASHGFLVKPLQLATQNGWNDACHALATLLCTFVTEEVDELVAQPAQLGLQVLIEIQSHPHTPVALIPLDCWLTIQEIPLSARHEHWKRPLFQNVVETLVRRIAYPTNFTNWQEELNVDCSEFQELRRMVTDVLVSSYFLLRVDLIHLLVNQIRTATHWTNYEAALYCLAQISKEVSARCKSNAANGTSIARDRNATCQELLQLLDQLIKQEQHTHHPLLLGGIINFCGSYAPAWNSMECPPEAILRLSTYLQSAFSVLPTEAAKATRAIYVSCFSKSLSNLEDIANQGQQQNATAAVLPLVLKSVRESMEVALNTPDEQAMTTVAEGAIRLITKLKDPTRAQQALVNDLIRPVLHRGQAAINVFPSTTNNNVMSTNSSDWLTPQVQNAVESLVRYLAVIQVVVRFCDAPHIPTMGEWLVQEIGPFLEMVQRQSASSPAQAAILPKWIGIHQKLLRTLSQQNMLMAMFSNTIPLVVQALEQTQDPSTLKYIAFAVEIFGGNSAEIDHSFQELLSHLTNVVTSQSNLSDATELLQAYFECLQRYVLYCPRALCWNPQFATILTLSVQSIAALQGAKESTRAGLNFLSQLFGWNLLRLSPQAQPILREAWYFVLREGLAHHGMNLTQVCVLGLAGGPQMLWPAYSDCLYAIVQVVINNPNEDASNNPADSPASSVLNESVIQHWLYNSMNSAVSNNNNTTMSAETCHQIIAILIGLARLGTKSRPKAKMLLTDFAKITKGEMAPNALLSYAIP